MVTKTTSQSANPRSMTWILKLESDDSHKKPKRHSTLTSIMSKRGQELQELFK